MKIREIVHAPVATVSPDTMLNDVAKLMKQHDCGSIPVVKSDKMIGMVTDRDIVIRCVAEAMDPMTITAEQCMSEGILYCYDDDALEDVAESMGDKKVRRMPIVDREKRLVGIVSLGDIAAACKDKDVPGEALAEIREAA